MQSAEQRACRHMSCAATILDIQQETGTVAFRGRSHLQSNDTILGFGSVGRLGPFNGRLYQVPIGIVSPFEALGISFLRVICEQSILFESDTCRIKYWVGNIKNLIEYGFAECSAEFGCKCR